MSVQDTWERLSPHTRRLLMMGSVLSGVALIAVMAFGPAATPTTRTQQAREQLTRTLLTEADPRALGIDGLAHRLVQLERQLQATNDRLVQRAAGDTDTVNRQVEQWRQAQQTQVTALQQELLRLKEAQAAIRPVPPPPAPPPIIPVAPVQEAPPAKPPALNAPALFDVRPTAPISTLNPNPTGRAPHATGPLAIRVVGAPVAIPVTTAAAATDPASEQVVIPAGSILQGVLLSGMDAATGKQARRDPYPALVRLKHNAILPNRFRADVRECFITVGGYGDLSSERAFLRTEVITCVRHDGGVIEVPVDGYAVGEDGKVGLRGRLVSKQGQVIARAMQVSFLEGISEVFGKAPVSVISTTPGNAVQYQDVLSGDSAQAAALSGTGKALDRLAQYYLDMAEDIFPVIEIDAGRSIEVILNRGASLRLNAARAARGPRG